MRITAGKFKNKQVKTLNSDLIRPTLSKIRESLFNVIQNNIIDATFLDLFAGSGIIGLEAASRGAKEIIFVEKNPRHYNLLKENLEIAQFTYKTFNTDAVKILERFDENKFDIIFSDPPYNTNLNNEIIKIISDKNLLQKNGMLIIECSKTEDFSDTIKENQFEIIKEKFYGDTKVIYLMKK